MNLFSSLLGLFGLGASPVPARGAGGEYRGGRGKGRGSRLHGREVFRSTLDLTSRKWRDRSKYRGNEHYTKRTAA